MPSFYSRRIFLLNGLSLALVKRYGQAQSLPINNHQDMIVSTCLHSISHKSKYNYLRVINLKTLKTAYIELPLTIGHGLSSHPTEPTRQIVIERDGPFCAEVDIASEKVIRKIESKKNWCFNGHAVFSKDGKYFVSCEHPDKEHNKGKIIVRNYASMKIEAEISSYGLDPHDLTFLNNDKTIAVTNYGHRTSHNSINLESTLSFIDFKSGQLIAQAKSSANDGIFFGHLTAVGQNSVSVGNLFLNKRRTPEADYYEKKLLNAYEERKEGFTNFSKIYENLQAPLIQANLDSESKKLEIKILDNSHLFHFGVAHDLKHHIIAASHRGSEIISFWDQRNGTKIWSVPFKQPTSIYFHKSIEKFIALSSFGEVLILDPINKSINKIAEDDKNYTGYFQISGTQLT